MSSSNHFNEWLELAGSLAPEVGYAVIVVFVLYLARQGWRTRNDWQIGPPWSEFTQYIKSLQHRFGHILEIGFGQQVAFYILGSFPTPSQRYNPAEAYDLESLLNLAALENKGIIVTGAPQSGKTTFLQALAVRAGADEFYRKLGFKSLCTPFYLDCRRVDTSLPPVEAIHRILNETALEITPRGVKRALNSARAFLLFDGLDDIEEPEQRRQTSRWIETVVKGAVRSQPFVIVCKPESLLQGLPFEFAHFTVAFKNYALQKYRTLRAVTETRMPPVFINRIEQQAKYMLVAPPPLPVILPGAKRPAPAGFYHLARYPVTNRLYRLFVEAQGHRPPLFWHEPGFSDDELPVTGVDWDDAEAYCAWLTHMSQQHAGAEDDLARFIYRLPTEEEWEWAASAGKRPYPWGETAPESRHANFDDQNCRLSPVDAHPEGATPEGIQAMAGNIWEWTSTAKQGKHEARVVKGGAVFNDPALLRCAAKDTCQNHAMRFAGFRVARIPQETQEA